MNEFVLEFLTDHSVQCGLDEVWPWTLCPQFDRNLPILNMTRSIIIIGVFVSMVKQISEFVLCKFPKSVAAKKLKILILPFKMSKKAQSKSAKCQKCSLPPKPINRFLFFRTWFQSSFPHTMRCHQLWHLLPRTRDLPRFVIVIKWIIIVFVYIIFFNDGTCICIVSIDFKTFRFALSFG